MLPAQRKKIDLSSLTEQEKLLLAKYGNVPNHKSILKNMQKDRKYFDSGDFALSKAGKAPINNVGTAFPTPQNTRKPASAQPHMVTGAADAQSSTDAIMSGETSQPGQPDATVKPSPHSPLAETSVQSMQPPEVIAQPIQAVGAVAEPSQAVEAGGEAAQPSVIAGQIGEPSPMETTDST